MRSNFWLKRISGRRWPVKTSLALILLGLVLFFVAPRAALGESSSVVAADEVMAKIRLGLPAEYDNVAIKGNLTSERLGLTAKQILSIPFEVKMPPSDEPTQANSSIVIKNSIIYGRVDFNNTVFHKLVSFENTLFVENASFGYSTFNGYSIRSCQFHIAFKRLIG